MKIEQEIIDCLNSTQSASQRFRAESAADYNNAAFASLLQIPISEQAHQLGEALGQLLFPEKPERTRGRPSNRKAQVEAALAFIADILAATQRELDRWVYRSLNVHSFSREVIGYRAFSVAVKALETAGLVLRLRGYWKKESAFGPVPEGGGFGRATRWQGTPNLFSLCASYGITPQNVEDHFRYIHPPCPVVLRSSSFRQGHLKAKGRPVKYIRSPLTDKIEAEVNEINELLSGYEIRGATHRGFIRGFNKGDDLATYQWNKGGRLYSIGEGHYQTDKKEDRQGITFDGRPVVEIDIRASHLTIYHVLRGVAFDPHERDPYGIDNIPRGVIKSWIVMAFGSGKLPRKWSSKAGQDYAIENEGRKLGKNYSIREVGETILNCYPVFRNLGSAGIDCFDLMYVESEAIIQAMLALLKQHDTPCLPVHDSLIVPEDSTDLAIEVLSECYESKVGLRPALRIERRDQG